MQPKMSIIVPIYNVEQYIGKCIESILSQKFKEFELILVDDGSTDESGYICDEYAAQDNRVKVIHKVNGGVSSARNVGIESSKGDYIGFVDPDDWIEEDMYQILYDLLEDTQADIAICRFKREIEGRIVDSKKDQIELKELNHLEALKELFKGQLYRFSLCNKLFRKKCFERVSFPEGRIHEDLSTTYKLFGNASKAIYTSYAGYIYVKREGSILNATYEKKRLQTFVGWQEILEYMKYNYPILVQQVIATFSYWCIDHILYVIGQVKDSKERKVYLKHIQQSVRENKKYIASNKLIGFKNKGYLLIFNYTCRVAILCTRLFINAKSSHI